MALELYQSSADNYNASSRGAREALRQDQAYHDPKVLMTGQVVVYSGRQPRPIAQQPLVPSQVVTSALNAQIVAEQVAQRVRHIASMESIFVQAKSWGFECWLVANHSTEDERFCLYDIEWQVMDTTPNTGFKFHLVDRQGRPLAEVVTLKPFDAMVTLHREQHA